ncbi:hypothetical protein CTAM01_00677 [Colletotrichum tamarilloi]|uniref:Uncharacterized protein n=1 Tax=Colletotrichum tamarilloi TaxID=1209934 RepID=A0ABQ9RRV6_9PEZI|nr:uncharacterized protein CTAM01_00677 [Colletotrichum tamarilloi]KAK1511747.1 hypothetical protein CTAM01_00677 [Colletotrichum tamarilloi]
MAEIARNTKLLFFNTMLKRPTLFTGRNDTTHNLLKTKMFPQRRTSTTLLRALSPERVHRYLTTYHPLSSPLLIRKGWGMNF